MLFPLKSQEKLIYNYMPRPLRSINKTCLHANQARASPPKGGRGGGCLNTNLKFYQEIPINLKLPQETITRTKT